jgi:hypothetical protein
MTLNECGAAYQRFTSLFSAEARQLRERKVRKIATQSRRAEEWFIDERFVKSAQARDEFIRDLLRFDFKDPS